MSAMGSWAPTPHRPELLREAGVPNGRHDTLTCSTDPDQQLVIRTAEPGTAT
ncbi:hypothetical protein [Streptomyces yanii]|uniref:hypothetical protein n=1 Tax=Streptomyces yanii TaxID=78510 RepID=UPI0031E9916A